jgi:hypothetical protein
MLLFLGEGASKAVGIGDLKDLSIKVNKEPNSQGYAEPINHIIKRLITSFVPFGFTIYLQLFVLSLQYKNQGRER